jgi:hypothetical protein
MVLYRCGCGCGCLSNHSIGIIVIGVKIIRFGISEIVAGGTAGCWGIERGVVVVRLRGRFFCLRGLAERAFVSIVVTDGAELYENNVGRKES